MEFRQIEAELRVLFPTTHGDEFKKIGVLFAMLQGCQPAKLQRATGYDGSLIYQVIEDVETHARFAIYSGAMAPRHLWALYPQTQTLIESITGQRLIKDSARPAPIAIPKPPQPSSNTIMSANTSATACGINECARPVGHDGRHRRADSKPRAPPVSETNGYYLLDIRFRMLQPHELAAAMSFPKTYVFTGNREQKVKQIGNAVPVGLAQALCSAILSA